MKLFWFRRDLRLEDNHGLFEALKQGEKVLPLFVFDQNILSELPKNDSRVNFIYQRITAVKTQLQKLGSDILVVKGKPKELIPTICRTFEINEVYSNKDYEPYGIERDFALEQVLNEKGISFLQYKDHVIFEANEVVKQDGSPYRVYTPYSKLWMEKLNQQGINEYPSESSLHNLQNSHSFVLPSLIQIGFSEALFAIPDAHTTNKIIEEYEAKRNFPGVNGTSKVGIHLRFGSISLRKLVAKANTHKNKTYLKELIWREFFMQIMWHFPHTIQNSFKQKYDCIQWRNDMKEFEKWCLGETGYPMVDAGMRELNKTGYMHNRVRMVVGSFLCKHLLIDWRLGEAYFAKKLLDYELSSNVGNWQWIAGCGVDAAPYFRIFNPTEQLKKFDQQLVYIKKWVPEYLELHYPKPMVDHKYARERCLSIYKKALSYAD